MQTSHGTSTSNSNVLDGKILLDLLRQPPSATSVSNVSNISNVSNVTKNPYTSPAFMPHTRNLPEKLPFDSYLRNPSHSSIRNNQNSSDNSLPKLLNTPDNTLATSMASMTLFGSNNLGLQRTQALDASIASLSRFPDESDRQISRGKKILSKTEFAQKYLNLIQVTQLILFFSFVYYKKKFH